jgi:hypothetical protein
MCSCPMRRSAEVTRRRERQAVCASRLKELINLQQYRACLAGSRAKPALTHRPDESRDPQSTYREVVCLPSAVEAPQESLADDQ